MKTAVNYISSLLVAGMLAILIAIFVLPSAKKAFDANPNIYHTHTEQR